jgi:hypothetical protein
MDIDHGYSIAICRINREWWTFDDREVHHTANVMDEETKLFERTALVFYCLLPNGISRLPREWQGNVAYLRANLFSHETNNNSWRLLQVNETCNFVLCGSSEMRD